MSSKTKILTVVLAVLAAIGLSFGLRGSLLTGRITLTPEQRARIAGRAERAAGRQETATSRLEEYRRIQSHRPALPSIRTIPLPTSNLANGRNTLISFAVRASSSAAASLTKATFLVRKNGAFKMHSAKLYEDERYVDRGVRIVSDTGIVMRSRVGQRYLDTMAVTVVWDDEAVIAANAEKIFRLEIWAEDVHPGDRIETSLLRDTAGQYGLHVGKIGFCGARCAGIDPDATLDLNAYLKIPLRDFMGLGQEQYVSLLLDDRGILNANTIDDSTSGPLMIVDPNTADLYDAVAYFDTNFDGEYNRGREIGVHIETENQGSDSILRRLRSAITAPLLYNDLNTDSLTDDIAFLDLNRDFSYSRAADIRLTISQNNVSFWRALSPNARPLLIEGSHFLWSDRFAPNHSRATSDWYNSHAIVEWEAPSSVLTAS